MTLRRGSMPSRRRRHGQRQLRSYNTDTGIYLAIWPRQASPGSRSAATRSTTTARWGSMSAATPWRWATRSTGRPAAGPSASRSSTARVAQQNVVHDNYYGISDFYERRPGPRQPGLQQQPGWNLRQLPTAAHSPGQHRLQQRRGRATVQLLCNNQISNNLIYANVNQGILVSGTTAAHQIVNNTVYQPVGDAVRIQGGSSGISLKNNILWTQAGYDLYVTPDSEQGFSSDYNDLYTTASGKLAFWEGPRLQRPHGPGRLVLRGGPGRPQPAHAGQPQRGRPVVH